jgi:hypothetical protein
MEVIFLIVYFCQLLNENRICEVLGMKWLRNQRLIRLETQAGVTSQINK